MINFDTERNYLEEDLLLLSGVQHMAFCERQWALIHLEQIWSENIHTIEGRQLHERVDDPFEDESRKTLRIVRALPIITWRLGLRGVADVVEFYQAEGFIEGKVCRLNGRRGWWRPVPVEYKRGRPKPDERDAVQLCAQAMALEEMLAVSLDAGYLYYGQTKRRVQVNLDEALRRRTAELAVRMHQLAGERKTPKAQRGKRCSQCSLVEQCQPYWMLRHRSIEAYLARMCRVEEDGL